MLRDAIEQYILWRQAHGAKFTTGANLLRHFLGYAQGDAACDAVSTTQVLAFLAGKGPLTRHEGERSANRARECRSRSCQPSRKGQLRRLFDPATVEISRRGAVQPREQVSCPCRLLAPCDQPRPCKPLAAAGQRTEVACPGAAVHLLARRIGFGAR